MMSLPRLGPEIEKGLKSLVFFSDKGKEEGPAGRGDYQWKDFAGGPRSPQVKQERGGGESFRRQKINMQSREKKVVQKRKVSIRDGDRGEGKTGKVSIKGRAMESGRGKTRSISTTSKQRSQNKGKKGS